MPGAEHTACTVEMVNMQRRVDVAVIDEIQMIGDETRCGCQFGLACLHEDEASVAASGCGGHWRDDWQRERIAGSVGCLEGWRHHPRGMQLP